MIKQNNYPSIIEGSGDQIYLKTFIYKSFISYSNLTDNIAYFRLPPFGDIKLKEYWIKTKDFSTNYNI